MSALESRGIVSVGATGPVLSALYGMASAMRRGTAPKGLALMHREGSTEALVMMADAARTVLLTMCREVGRDATADDLAVIERWRLYLEHVNAVRYFAGCCGDCAFCLPDDADGDDLCHPDHHAGRVCENAVAS